MTTPPIGEGRGGRKRRQTQDHRSRNTIRTNSATSGTSSPTAPANVVAKPGLFSHIRIVPRAPVELTPEQRMQRTNPFVYKQRSFAEEAEANNSNLLNWQANLSNASDGASFAQKARAAELNAARARRAAQMQSIDDEIPDLSGPVSLGRYKFTRRGRGKKYETHKVSELQDIEEQEQEGENKVTESGPNSSAHLPSNLSLPPPTTLPSHQIPERPAQPVEAELDLKKSDRLDKNKDKDKPSPEKGDLHEPGLPYNNKLNLSHNFAPFPGPIRSAYIGQLNPQASGQGNPSFPPAQDHRSNQASSAVIYQDTHSLGTSGQGHHLFPPGHHSSNHHLSSAVNPHRQGSQPASQQAHHNSVSLQGISSNQNPYASINADKPSSRFSGQNHNPFPPQDHSSRLNFYASTNPHRQSSQALFGPGHSSIARQGYSTDQNPYTQFNPRGPSPQAVFGPGHSSFSRQGHNTNQNPYAPINPYRPNSQAASGRGQNSFPHQVHNYFPHQVHNSFPPQAHSSNQNPYAPITVDRSSTVSGQARHPYPLPQRQLDTSDPYGDFTRSLHALIETDRQRSKASGQASPHLPPQNPERNTFRPHREIEGKDKNLLAVQRESLQASTPASSSPRSLPLSDNLPTAVFNLRTNQWEPDLPVANMPTHTPTTKSARGGHSSQQSSRQPSSRVSNPSQDARNPHAIVTTTKSGRPYTNPYMPIDQPPSAAHQTVGKSPSGHINPDTRHDDAEMVQRQQKIHYLDQEEARYRALEEEASLDDPFQDQPTHIQNYGRYQPSTFAEHAAQQAAYGQLPFYGHQPTLNSYASDPNASSYLSSPQQTTQAPNTGMSPYHGQRSVYEQKNAVTHRAQNSGPTPHDQRSAYEQQLPTNPRASVRLPAVRGTLDQQKGYLQEQKLENLSLGDSTGNNAPDPHRRHTQGVQPVPGRTSHAVPIRDPAAYTGSGLTMRRNQEVLRQNLDTVVASSQGPTASARTVMNDPHRDRQPLKKTSPTLTDTAAIGSAQPSTLRAQAPSYQSATTQRLTATNLTDMPRPGSSRRQGTEALGGSEVPHLQHHAASTLKSPERPAADAKILDLQEPLRGPAIPSGLGYDVAAYTKNVGLPAEAIGAGNAFMDAVARQAPQKLTSEQRLEDAATWFRRDPRDLSYAAAILPREIMNRINPEQFPLETTAPQTVSRLSDNSQDDEPSGRARRAATPRPIGHGRPAGFSSPPSIHGSGQDAMQAPVSALAGAAPTNDKEEMERRNRKFLDDEAQMMEAMAAGAFSNLMELQNGPYDYLNHYAPPPAYAIDHNVRNNQTRFDPQWFATAPPARVGRDPRREQGEYEDPTQGSASRRGDGARGDLSRRGSSGRAWGMN